MEHCNTDAIRGLVSLIYSDAEEHYGKLFRIVSGDDVLEALDDPSLSLAS
jgi:isopentenyl phosphate kinase